MKKQQGLSFFGFIIIGVFVGVMAVIFMKVVPAYNQYFSIKKTIARLAKENAGSTPAAIKDAFSRNAEIGYIEDVKPDDLKSTQVGSVTRIVVNYEKIVPLLDNVSLLFDFRIDESSGKPAGN